MHEKTVERWQHGHDFIRLHREGRKRSLQVLILTLAVMLLEIAAGTAFGSMALLADGWHMSTHAIAFGIVLAAYHFARKHARDAAFSFGTGKFSVLGGFASAILLAVVALSMLVESGLRLVNPVEIRFNEALGVAVLGLAVNIAGVLILKTPHDHHHAHEEGRGEGCGHRHGHDHNLKAAYLHVLADALTSVLAILALLAGKYFGWNRLDAAVGMAGALVITRWAAGLLRETAPILLDSSAGSEVTGRIRRLIEQEGDARISDLHVWKVGPDSFAVILSVVSHTCRPPEHYKDLLRPMDHLEHVTIEVNPCADTDCPAAR